MEFPGKIWIVVEAKQLPDGSFVPDERHVFFQEPMGGIEAWKKDAKCWVAEYSLTKAVHEPPRRPAR